MVVWGQDTQIPVDGLHDEYQMKALSLSNNIHCVFLFSYGLVKTKWFYVGM